MSRNRLQSALDEGTLTLPEGPVAVLRPPAGYDLTGLDRAQVTITHTFRPDAVFWEAAGYPVVPAPEPAATALVVVPRAKALARALIAAAARTQLVVVDGQKVDGVDALWRDLRKLLNRDLPSVTRAHGRLFWFESPEAEALAAWAMPAPAPGPHGFHTLPGVFSDGAVDAGSALLAEALPATLPKRMADLGAGWGYLSLAVLARAGVENLDLIEAESLALDCARLNVTDPRARFLWEDATRFAPDQPFDGIVMNPPFHQGRAADPALGQAFIGAARRMLTREGQLWMVANRHLPYEATLREAFRSVSEIGGNGGFKLFHAARPLR